MVRKRNIERELEEFLLDPREPVFTTGVISRLLGVPVWVLKQLDREGIVSPPRKQKNTSRLYSIVQLKKVRKCWYYISERGVKVNGLKIILELEEKIK